MEEAEAEIQGGSDEPKKCPDCKEYYGAEAYGGKCSVCYKRPSPSDQTLGNTGVPLQGMTARDDYRPKMKVLCKVPGCSFMAELDGFCRACYAEHFHMRN